MKFSRKLCQRSQNPYATTIPRKILAIKDLHVDEGVDVEWNINEETGVVVMVTDGWLLRVSESRRGVMTIDQRSIFLSRFLTTRTDSVDGFSVPPVQIQGVLVQ